MTTTWRRAGWLAAWTSCALVAVLLAVQAVDGQQVSGRLPSPVDAELLPGFERRLAADQQHQIRFQLTDGELLDLHVTQEEVDVELVLKGPGDQVRRVDGFDGPHGVEPMPVIGAGTFTIEIVPFDGVADCGPDSKGTVLVEVVARRPATPRDRLRVRAEQALALGRSLNRSGEFALALAQFRAAADGFVAADDIRRQADARYWIGRMQRQLGAWNKAAIALREAASLFEQVGWDHGVLRSLVSQAEPLRVLGALRASRNVIEEAIRIGEGLAPHQPLLLGQAFGHLGKWFEGRGWIDRARAAHQRSVDLFREIGYACGLQRAELSLGILDLQSNPRDALVRFDQAKQWHCVNGTLDAELALNRGKALMFLGRHQEGLAAIQAGRRRLDDAPNRLLSIGWQIEGWALRLVGQVDEARVALSRARLGFLAIDDAASAAATALELAFLDLDLLPAGRCLAPMPATVMAVPGLPPRSPTWVARRLHSVLNDFRAHQNPEGELQARAALMRQACAVNDLETALHHAEAALDVVDLLRPELGDLAERERWFARKRQLFETALDLAMALDQVSPRFGHAVRAFALAERRRARNLAELLAPADDEENEEAGTGTIEAARALLDDKTTLLAYALGRRSSYVWVVTRETFHVERLESEEVIAAEVGLLADLLAMPPRHRNRGLEAQLWRRLGDLLLTPVADRLQGREIVIVPDGPLWFVPFAALPLPPSDSLTELVPMVAKYEISVVPSVSVLGLQRQRCDRGVGHGVAIFADPVFGGPQDERVPSGSAPIATTSPLRRLRGSGEEGRRLARRFGTLSGFEAYGWSANRETFLGGVLTGKRIIHVATHAEEGAFEDQGEIVLVLSQLDERGQAVDARVRLDEIADLDLDADLVVLSACGTGLGVTRWGEGLAGLGYAFMRAGAAQVLVTLAPVHDQHTVVWMDHFYDALVGEGQSPAAAVARAQRQLRAAPDPALHDPRAWAPFALQGSCPEPGDPRLNHL